METFKFLMTTTFYPPYHVGGDAIQVKYLADELIKRGHELHILHSIDAYKFKKKKLPDEYKISGVSTYQIKEPLNLSAYTSYMFGTSSAVTRKFEELVNTVKPDIVHHHNISLLGYPILKKKSNYKNLLTTHDFWLVCQLNSLLRNGSEVCESKSCFFCVLKCRKVPQVWRHLKSFKESVKSIDLLISPSDYFRRKLDQRLRLRSVTLANFAPSPPAKLCSSTYSNYFLFVGALELQKGILELLRLFKQLGQSTGLKLVIAGDGSLRDEIVDFIRKNSLESFVHYVGRVDDKETLYSLYKNALALVIPSILVENAPLVALEAFSVGCPVIGSNIGGLPEIIGKLDKKLIFRNFTELKNLLLTFSKSEFKSEQIKEIYNTNFSPETFLEKYFNLIYSLQ